MRLVKRVNCDTYVFYIVIRYGFQDSMESVMFFEVLVS